MLNVVSPRGLQHVECARYVGLHIRIGAVVTEGDGNERCEVQHMATATRSRINPTGITDITRYHLNLTQHLLFDGFESAPRVEGVVVNKRTNVMACSHQLFGEVRTNKSICACYQYLVCHDLIAINRVFFLSCCGGLFRNEASG